MIFFYDPVVRFIGVDDRDLILSPEPAAQVDQLAALGAEREMALLSWLGFFDGSIR